MKNEFIDFHVHAFPPEMGTAAKGATMLPNEPFWNALMVEELLPQAEVDESSAAERGTARKALRSRSLQGWVSVEQMLRHMDDAGIERVVLQGWYWQRAETAQAHNAWMAACVRRYPDRLSAFAAWVPLQEQEPHLSRIEDQGFCGLGELHPGVQGFSLASEQWLVAAAFAAKRSWPVLLHVTEPVGRPYAPREETDFRELQAFIESHPSLSIVLAHWGGLVFTHLLNPYIAKRWKHVYFDCAASALLYDAKVMRLALEVLSAERILFGSDYPLRLYPNDARQPEFYRFLNSMQEQVKEELDWKRISRGNASRLLGFDRSDEGR
ncbi:MAG: amidohydrolase family protein [Puniceicoccaceae bacterium]